MFQSSLYDLLLARNVGGGFSDDIYSSLLAKSVTFVEDTATGNPATFTTDLAKKLTGAKIYFNPVQDGTGDPSPENIRAISGWTGCNVVRCGKNLLDPAEKMVTSSKIARWCYTNGYVLRAGQTYTLSSNTASAQVKIIDLSTDTDIESGSPSATYTPAEDTTVYFKLYNLDGIIDVQAQLELGSTATTYAPYTGQTIPVQFPAEAGTIYGGYVDLVNSEVVVTWDGMYLKDLPWELATNTSPNGTAFTCQYVWENHSNTARGRYQGQCNAFTLGTGSFAGGGGLNASPANSWWYTSASANKRGFRVVYGDESETVDNFVNFLTQNNVFVVGERNSFIHYPLTTATLTALVGDNVVSSNTNSTANEIKYLKRS